MVDSDIYLEDSDDGRVRAHYLARLHAERAHFLWQLRGLPEETLTSGEVMPGWSAKNLAIHVAHYDAVHTERIQLVLDGRAADIPKIGDESGLANHNALLLEQIKEIPPEQAIAMLLKERGGFQAVLQRVSSVQLDEPIILFGSGQTSIREWADWRYRHDMDHAQHLAAWRQSLPREAYGQTPTYLLRAILHAGRKAFLALLPLMPPDEWITRPVCGVWTMKDLLGHLADWEKVAVDGMRQLAAGQTPEFDVTIADFDAFNNPNAAARKGQPWEEVWADFQTTRDALLELLAQATAADLARSFAAPWGGDIRGYQWLHIWPGHDMEHAVDVRAALQLAGWPERFIKH